MRSTDNFASEGSSNGIAAAQPAGAESGTTETEPSNAYDDHADGYDDGLVHSHAWASSSFGR